MPQPRAMFQKVSDSHTVVKDPSSGEVLLYVDRLMLTDTSSFHAFDALRSENRPVRRAGQIFGGPDHFASSKGNRIEDIADDERRNLVQGLATDCAEYGINHFDLQDARMGISHVVGPEQGLTLPGFFLLCGDSHTSTHGALGALAFRIGGQTSHVMATQCLWVRPLKAMRKSNRLRALAVTSAQPSALAPGLPTVASFGLPGYEVISTLGMFAPAKTPASLISHLNKETVGFLSKPEVRENFLSIGVETVCSSPDELSAKMKSEIERVGKLINDAGIKAN